MQHTVQEHQFVFDLVKHYGSSHISVAWQQITHWSAQFVDSSIILCFMSCHSVFYDMPHGAANDNLLEFSEHI